ncbi:unnamed protein product, partial [Polarella glacialis]
GIYAFLDLDSLCDAQWNGVVYRSARHAQLAAQFPDAVDSLQGPAAATVEEAKKLVVGEDEAKDWSDSRLKVMEKILRDKFRRSDDFRKKLQDTGTRELLWENPEDTFWGVAKGGRGQNHLGRLLMEIRAALQDNTEFEMWLTINCELESENVRRPPIELIEVKTLEDGSTEQKSVHRLTGNEYFKLGKLPSNAVQSLHPSVSREHAILIHTKAEVARCSGGVAVMDLGSKSGTAVDGKRLPHAFVIEPLKAGSTLKLGASTRTYDVRVNLNAQIEQLEQQQRDLMRDLQIIDQDAADPIKAAKRLAKEEATVFVGSLDFETEKADLLGLFQDCGHLEEVRFPGNQEAGGKAVKGIAFVVFDTPMAARRAVGLSGELFKGRRVKIALAADGGRDKGKGGGKDGGKGGGGGKGRDDYGGKGDSGGGGKNGNDSSRQFLRDMLDGKWEKGVMLGSQSPERPRRGDERRPGPGGGGGGGGGRGGGRSRSRSQRGDGRRGGDRGDDRDDRDPRGSRRGDERERCREREPDRSGRGRGEEPEERRGERGRDREGGREQNRENGRDRDEKIKEKLREEMKDKKASKKKSKKKSKKQSSESSDDSSDS